MKPKVVKERVLKRIFDLLVSGAVLCLFSPVLLLVILLIKLQGLVNPSFKGPVFYKETRFSRGNPFEIYKFRTVKSDILKILKRSRGEKSITEFTIDAKHLTPAGRFLARTYLDEFPQFFNVLKGEMSLVGPRPHYPPQYMSDLKEGIISAKYIKAGICGLIQASKANSAMSETLIRMAKKHATNDKAVIFVDRLYFRKYLTASAPEMLFYDMWIIWKCIIVIFRAKGLN